TLTIDASNLSSGVYFYTVFAGEDAVTKKMIVN
ncbi:MAG: T9SS type A sorting domain-containing protein, partial [Bacteroidetes bacterium]|nr:T9SS type A sorting domain-containing protein [Bacteroidota bacterium]